MRIFWSVYADHRDEIDQAVLSGGPEGLDARAFGADLGASVVSPADERARRLQEGALLRGEWGPYLRTCREQGEAYATRGVPYAAWHAATEAVRTAATRILVRELGDRPEVLATALAGGQRWLDLAVEHLVEGYLVRLDAVASRVRELERSNEALERLALVAAHDLRAPLRDVGNLARWIGEDLEGLVPEETERHLALLRQRVAHMEELLDDLLQLARAGGARGAAEEVDLGVLVRQVADLAGLPDAFQLVVEEPMPRLHTPLAPLAQVLRNLLANAARHHPRPDGTVTVRAEDLGERVRIAVSDDGPGIASEHQRRIFAGFTTLGPSGVAGGTGMGLAIVKKLVETYGGTIDVESEEGRGATFRFTWPSGLDPEQETAA